MVGSIRAYAGIVFNLSKASALSLTQAKRLELLASRVALYC